jgi:fructosamine-3-kinase
VIAEAAASALGRPLAGARRVSGGDINDAWLVELDGGVKAFVKTRAGVPAGEYATEAAALRWLGEAPEGLPVPGVLAVRDDLLALEWIEEGRLDAAGEEALGRGLAHLHRAGAPAFGAPPPGAPNPGLRIGTIDLPAGTAPDWPAYYAEYRIAPLLRAAADRGALPAGGGRAIEGVMARLPELAGPDEPPARLHGDLWRGNVLPGARDGRPWLIDPAAYGGHREVDLAMLALFGAPSPRTLAAYEEVHPLTAGHRDRMPLWQVFPLLVHAVLFGGSYGSSAVRAARAAA